MKPLDFFGNICGIIGCIYGWQDHYHEGFDWLLLAAVVWMIQRDKK